MKLLQRLISMWTVLIVAACGGGGDAGTSTFGGGSGSGSGGTGTGTTTGPTVTLSVSSVTVTATTPATVTATVRDASGLPISGVVVNLATGRTDIGQLSAVSVLTNSNGSGSVGLLAASSGLEGADQVIATATLGTTTVTGRVGFSVTGAASTISTSVSSSTLRASSGPATVTATVRNESGAGLPGQIVNFGSTSGRVTLAASSALTDSNGTANTQISPADGSVGVADTIVVSTIVNNRSLQSSVNVQVIPESPTLALALSNTTATAAAPVTVSVTVRDAANNPVVGTVVSFSTQFGVGRFAISTALTNGTGVATAVVAPSQLTSAGADMVQATVTVAGVTRSAQKAIEISASATSGSPSLAVTLSGTTVTPVAPATVTVALVDGSGNPVRQTVVSVSTQRGNLATLSQSSVLTDNNGAATLILSSSGSGAAGADDVVASASVGATAVQGRAGFTVVAAAPTLSLSPSTAGLRVSASPVIFSATVRDAAGNLAAGQLVRFTGSAGLLKLDLASALTNGSGIASVSVTPQSPSSSGVALVTATATVAGRDTIDDSSVTLTPEAPTMSATVTNTTVTSAAPVTMRAVLRGLDGNLVPAGTVVSFTSQFGLASFSPATATTNVNGEATTVISPRLATSNGADPITASATVQGLQALAVSVLQFAGTTPAGTPTLELVLSRTSISAASPADVTVRLRDATGTGVAGQVVTFGVIRSLATTNVVTALTNASGEAVVVLSPVSSVTAGADEVTATVSFAGVSLQRTAGFQVQATPVTLDSFASAASPLSAYGQTTLTLTLTGANVTSPVNISVSSSCVSQGKATISPSTFTATGASVSLQYRDNGCGAVQTSDQLLAVVTSTGTSRALSLPINPPSDSSIAFVQASPEQIFLRGSGFTESSVVTFEVRDAASNPLPNRVVELRLQTGAGGVLMEGRGVESVNPPSDNPFVLSSNALGRVAVRVNSGTLPTPVRVNARLQANTSIATVSSNLSVAVGLPSQLNFSLSQGTRNIEGYDIDGTTNTYQIIAADRSGNPVPAGTSINFVTEGGQIEAIKQTQIVNGIARVSANFVSSSPRPVDGRVTVTVYALGEESFLDTDGNNAYNTGEPFQDLGNIFRDRNFDGVFDPAVDEFIPLNVNNTGPCTVPTNALLNLNPTIPSVPGKCDGNWSGAGQVYVRRSAETVLSTSAGRPLWANTSGLSGTCAASEVKLQVGSTPALNANFLLAGNDTWYGGGTGSLSFIVADANPGRPKPLADWATSGVFNRLVDYIEFPRLNPMAADSKISAASGTPGLTATVGGGSPVANTTEATGAAVSYAFDDLTSEGTIFVTFTSPGGTGTTVTVPVVRGARPTVCSF
jgi:hypothetical protein